MPDQIKTLCHKSLTQVSHQTCTEMIFWLICFLFTTLLPRQFFFSLSQIQDSEAAAVTFATLQSSRGY